MKVACFLGVLGSFLSLWLGVFVIGFTLRESALCVLGANLSGIFALWVTLEWEHWLGFRWSQRTSDLGGTLNAWIFLSSCYLGSLLLLLPFLRNPYKMLIMTLPLLLSLGFCILVFGPVRDGIVKKRQKKRFSCIPSDSIL